MTDHIDDEIARLQTEVERLRKNNAILHNTIENVFAAGAAQWNDAIEAAAEDVSDWGELYASRNGSPMMQEILHDIRALRREKVE